MYNVKAFKKVVDELIERDIEWFYVQANTEGSDGIVRPRSIKLCPYKSSVSADITTEWIIYEMPGDTEYRSLNSVKRVEHVDIGWADLSKK